MEKKISSNRNSLLNPRNSIKQEKKQSVNFINNVKSKNTSSKNNNNLINKSSIINENKFQNAIVSKKSTSKDIAKMKSDNQGNEKPNQNKKIIDYIGNSSLAKNKGNINKNSSNENQLKDMNDKNINQKLEKSKSIVNKYFNFYLDDFLKTVNIGNENFPSKTNSRLFKSNIITKTKNDNIIDNNSPKAESSEINFKQESEHIDIKKEFIKININNNNYYSNSTSNQDKEKSEVKYYSVESEPNQYNNNSINENVYNNKRFNKNNDLKNSWNYNQIYNEQEILRDNKEKNISNSIFLKEKIQENTFKNPISKINNLKFEDEIEITNKIPFSTRFNNPRNQNSKKTTFESEKKDYRNIYFATDVTNNNLKIFSDSNFYKKEYSVMSYVPLSRKEKNNILDDMNQSSFHRLERYSVLFDKLKNQLSNINELLLSKEEEEHILQINEKNLNKRYSEIRNDDNKLLQKLNTISEFLTDKMSQLEKAQNEYLNQQNFNEFNNNTKKSPYVNYCNKEFENNDFILCTSQSQNLRDENLKISFDRIFNLDSMDFEDKKKNMRNNLDRMNLYNFSCLDNDIEKNKISIFNSIECDNFNATNLDILNESLENIEKKIHNIEKIVNKTEFENKEAKILKDYSNNKYTYPFLLISHENLEFKNNNLTSSNNVIKNNILENKNLLIKNDTEFSTFNTPIKRENFHPSNYLQNIEFNNNDNFYSNKENSIRMSKPIKGQFIDNQDESILSPVKVKQSHKPIIKSGIDLFTNTTLENTSNINNSNNLEISKINSNLQNKNIGNIKISLIKKSSSRKFGKFNDNIYLFTDKEIDEKTDTIKIPDSIIKTNQFSRLYEDSELKTLGKSVSEDRGNDRKKRDKFSYDLRMDNKILKDLYDYNKNKIENNLPCFIKDQRQSYNYNKK